MFFEALQSYCAPVLTLSIFIVIILKDTLFSKKVRNLFLCETFVILLIITATWLDRCLSDMNLLGTAWRLRTATTFVNFAFSPISPLLLMLIYNAKPLKKQVVQFLPLLINLALCIASIATGWIFRITPDNGYSRGELFLVPFIVSGFYLVAMIWLSIKETKFNRRQETIALIAILMAITIATLLETIFVKRFMIWSTTTGCVVIYFMILSRQKIQYDDLTGTYSRTAYTNRIERLCAHSSCTIAMIDIDRLKETNDTLGHLRGDEAIAHITSVILKKAGHKMQLYRIGGDEFALIAVNKSPESVQIVLEKARASCGEIGGIALSFSYGVAALSYQDTFETARSLADTRLYEHKAQNKMHEASEVLIP